MQLHPTLPDLQQLLGRSLLVNRLNLRRVHRLRQSLVVRSISRLSSRRRWALLRPPLCLHPSQYPRRWAHPRPLPVLCPALLADRQAARLLAVERSTGPRTNSSWVQASVLHRRSLQHSLGMSTLHIQDQGLSIHIVNAARRMHPSLFPLLMTNSPTPRSQNVHSWEQGFTPVITPVIRNLKG